MKFRARLWTSISAATLIAASGAVSGLAASTADGAAQAASGHDNAASFLAAVAGEGGEGEGGEGGEGGVDPAFAAKDPVLYLSALDIIRAHYLAGEAMLDVEGGREAAGEMFAHPISEVYIDLEPVFEAQGVAPFMDEMTEAVDLALSDAPVADVRAVVAKLYSALDAAEKAAPESGKSEAVIEAALTVDMFERAARQYEAALQPAGSDEAWVDGYGFWKAAELRADALSSLIDDGQEDLAAALASARELFGAAYASPERPEKAEIDAGELLAASALVNLRASRL
jgi:hypothetical protein